MQPTTVLAKCRVTVDLSAQTKQWLQAAPEFWGAGENGDIFLSEFGGAWTEVILPILNEEVQNYFREIGVPNDYLPTVQRAETYRGSWILETAIVTFSTVGTTYAILKGTSEIPKIADGLSDLKSRISRRIKPALDRRVAETLTEQVLRSTHPLQLSPPPPNPTTLDLVIDARPLRSLTPAQLKHHKIHLSVGISRDSFTLENLGDDTLHNIHIGLFRSDTQQHQWNYQESYMGEVSLISPKQTIAKRLDELRDQHKKPFDLSDGTPVHVDCWISDNHGIYLFHFYLDR